MPVSRFNGCIDVSCDINRKVQKLLGYFNQMYQKPGNNVPNSIDRLWLVERIFWEKDIVSPAYKLLRTKEIIFEQKTKNNK